EHDIYLRGEIPAAAVAAPGVEYFVEAAQPTGSAGAAWATPDRPTQLDVAPAPVVQRFVEGQHRTRLSLMSSYLDFGTRDDRGGNRTDQFSLAEVTILYRLGDGRYGVRAGYGSYGGRGGRANRDWGDRDPPLIGFQYGYAEVELRAPAKYGVPFG